MDHTLKKYKKVLLIEQFSNQLVRDLMKFSTGLKLKTHYQKFYFFMFW